MKNSSLFNKFLDRLSRSDMEKYSFEIELHRINKEWKYLPKIKFGGDSECFKEYKILY